MRMGRGGGRSEYFMLSLGEKGVGGGRSEYFMLSLPGFLHFAKKLFTSLLCNVNFKTFLSLLTMPEKMFLLQYECIYFHSTDSLI